MGDPDHHRPGREPGLNDAISVPVNHPEDRDACVGTDVAADSGGVIPDGEDATDLFILDLLVEGVAAVVDDRNPGRHGEARTIPGRGGADRIIPLLHQAALRSGIPVLRSFSNP